ISTSMSAPRIALSLITCSRACERPDCKASPGAPVTCTAALKSPIEMVASGRHWLVGTHGGKRDSRCFRQLLQGPIDGLTYRNSGLQRARDLLAFKLARICHTIESARRFGRIDLPQERRRLFLESIEISETIQSDRLNEPIEFSDLAEKRMADEFTDDTKAGSLGSGDGKDAAVIEIVIGRAACVAIPVDN